MQKLTKTVVAVASFAVCAPLTFVGVSNDKASAATVDDSVDTAVNMEGRDFKVVVDDEGRKLNIPLENSRPVQTESKVSTAPVFESEALRQASTAPGSVPDETQSARSMTVKKPRIVTVLNDGAWSWYMNPRVLKTERATYVGSTDHNGGIDVVRLAVADNRLDYRQVDKIDAMPMNPGEPRGGIDTWGRTVNPYLMDDHAAPSFLQAKDGRIAVFWSGHATTPVYYRVSARPDSVNTFSSRRKLTGSGIENANATYTQLHRMDDDAYPYWLFTRLRGKVKENANNWYLTRTRDFKTWTKAIQITKNPYSKPSNCSMKTDGWSCGWPYLKIVGNGRDTLDFSITDSDPVNYIENSQYHFRIKDGKVLKSDGRVIRSLSAVAGANGRPMPIDPREGTLIYNGRNNPDGPARVYDIQRGPNGQLVIAMTTNSHMNKKFVFKWITLKKGQWVQHTLDRDTVWPYGFELTNGEPNRVYGVVHNDATNENVLSEYWTDDEGETWSKRPVQNSPKDVRNPVVPWNVKGPDDGPAKTVNTVFWNEGRWKFFNDYNTDVRMETTGRTPLWTRPSLARRSSRVTVSGVVTRGVAGVLAGRLPVRVRVDYPSRATTPDRTYTVWTDRTGRYKFDKLAPRDTRFSVQTLQTPTTSSIVTKSYSS